MDATAPPPSADGPIKADCSSNLPLVTSSPQTSALVMAGGTGSRMRDSGVDVPKPLVQIRGATLLERNLFSLLRSGCKDITVSVPSAAPAIAAYVRARGAELAASRGATVSVHTETEPLGNAGAAGTLADRAEQVLLAFADNLTTLDLSAFAERHADSGVALSLAAHYSTSRLPYGELEVRDALVVGFNEKPERCTLICSGLAVLGPTALAALRPARFTRLVDLFTELQRRALPVGAFLHSAPWIDVNDRSAIETASAMVEARHSEFECWLPTSAPIAPRRLVLTEDAVLARRVQCLHGSRIGWELPDAKDNFDGKRIRDHGVLDFDDVEPATGRAVRFRVRACADASDEAQGSATWLPISELANSPDVLSPLRRAVAMFRHSSDRI